MWDFEFLFIQAFSGSLRMQFGMMFILGHSRVRSARKHLSSLHVLWLQSQVLIPA